MTANRILDEALGGEGPSPIRFGERRRETPRVLQALPLRSVRRRRPVWPTLLVLAVFLGIAILTGLVPRVVEVLLAVMP